MYASWGETKSCSLFVSALFLSELLLFMLIQKISWIGLWGTTKDNLRVWSIIQHYDLLFCIRLCFHHTTRIRDYLRKRILQTSLDIIMHLNGGKFKVNAIIFDHGVKSLASSATCVVAHPKTNVHLTIHCITEHFVYSHTVYLLRIGRFSNNSKSHDDVLHRFSSSIFRWLRFLHSFSGRIFSCLRRSEFSVSPVFSCGWTASRWCFFRTSSPGGKFLSTFFQSSISNVSFILKVGSKE